MIEAKTDVFMFLSKQQLKACELLAKGYTSTKIADELGMHRNSVFRTLKESYEILLGFDGQYNATRLMLYCLKNGLVKLEDLEI